ncbi:MAG: DHA2 family efflux MFS transporter permease subunit [Candidatus Micrarchaeota archaeon]|nr:DHA2 family efflux MFS transporter permease subunit [Candidatus Micrarchaeota archaeon]
MFENMKGDLRWLILLTLMIGTSLGMLDQTIVNLAFPKIMNDFSITLTEVSWIATAYILANAVFVPVWGKLGDTMGRKKIYILGFSIFIVGSILAAFAWNLNSMIFFRIIQAIASSANYPTAMAILTVTFRDAKERAQALGIWSASFAAASVFGPLIGGPLIDTFGWRSVFLVNLPVGIIALFMAISFVPESKSERPTANFDIWGALTLGIALSALVLVLNQGIDWGWTSNASLICYAVMLIFAYIFYRIEQNHPEPIVDPKFFAHSAFVTTLANNFVVFMGMMGCLFILPNFAQTFLGYTATQTGYLFMPMAVAMMISAPLGASFVGKVQPRYVIALSTLVASFGLFLFMGLDARSSALDIIVPIFVMASGMGFGMAQRTTIISSTVPEHEIGAASSVLSLARSVAGAFGIALFATIQKDAMENAVISLSQNTIINSMTPSVIQQVIALIYMKAQIISYHTVFFWGFVILLIGSALALTINVKETKTGKEVFED